jgi:hypothetical protein
MNLTYTVACDQSIHHRICFISITEISNFLALLQKHRLPLAIRVANIFPIAGTFKRTGNDEEDVALAKKLEEDPKESAEHVMLVDLARNDLSRHCSGVAVKVF